MHAISRGLFDDLFTYLRTLLAKLQTGLCYVHLYAAEEEKQARKLRRFTCYLVAWPQSFHGFMEYGISIPFVSFRAGEATNIEHRDVFTSKGWKYRSNGKRGPREVQEQSVIHVKSHRLSSTEYHKPQHLKIRKVSMQIPICIQMLR